MKRIIFFVLVSAFFCGTSLAETYKWEDKNGIHFTDNPGNIPKKYQQKAIADATGDITTADPEVRESVERSERRAASRNAEDARNAPRHVEPAKPKRTLDDCINEWYSRNGRGTGYGAIIAYNMALNACAPEFGYKVKKRNVERELRQQETDEKIDRIDRKLNRGY